MKNAAAKVAKSQLKLEELKWTIVYFCALL